MAIYVDKIFSTTPNNSAKKHGDQWCHFFCDSEDIDLLHEIAIKIGLEKSYFQDKKHGELRFPHYDLTPAKRQLAIENGAVEMPLKDFIINQLTAHKQDINTNQDSCEQDSWQLLPPEIVDGRDNRVIIRDEIELFS